MICLVHVRHCETKQEFPSYGAWTTARGDACDVRDEPCAIDAHPGVTCADSACAEQPVTRIAEPWQDISVLVEFSVEGGAVDRNIGM